MMKQNITQRYDKYKQEKKYIQQGFFGILDKITGSKESEEVEGVPIANEVILDPSALKLIQELELHMKASHNYIPPEYDGAVHIIQCASNQKNMGKIDDWKKLVPSATFATVSGDHYNCMKEPHVTEVAAEITKAMDDVIFKSSGIPRESKDVRVKVLGVSRIVHKRPQNDLIDAGPPM